MCRLPEREGRAEDEGAVIADGVQPAQNRRVDVTVTALFGQDETGSQAIENERHDE